MFEKLRVEIYGSVDASNSCRHAPGKPVSEHVLEMKGLMDQLHTLGKPYDNDMAVNLINRSLNKDFGFERKATTPQVFYNTKGLEITSQKTQANKKGQRQGKENPNKDKLVTTATLLGIGEECPSIYRRVGEIRRAEPGAAVSRYGYVYLLKHKHEVFETFKVFKAEVELQLGKKIKALRSDRGGEYLSQEFKDYLSENGIVQNLTSPCLELFLKEDLISQEFRWERLCNGNVALISRGKSLHEKGTYASAEDLYVCCQVAHRQMWRVAQTWSVISTEESRKVHWVAVKHILKRVISLSSMESSRRRATSRQPCNDAGSYLSTWLASKAAMEGLEIPETVMDLVHFCDAFNAIVTGSYTELFSDVLQNSFKFCFSHIKDFVFLQIRFGRLITAGPLVGLVRCMCGHHPEIFWISSEIWLLKFLLLVEEATAGEDYNNISVYGRQFRPKTTKHGFKEERKLSYGDQYLQVGNGTQAAVEAIGMFDLVLPSGLVLKLNNCYYAPSIVRGVVSLSCLLDLGFHHTIASNGISVSLNGIFYFSAISVNGVFEIDINNNVPKNNNNSIFSINKKRKLDLDSSYLWHCRLAHIGKTRMQKLHREGLLENIDEESFDKCESCISGKMTKKPFNKNIERATDLLGLIHTDVCGPLRHVSRKGASYFLTFTDDFSRYGYVYLLKHKHEVFETFKVFKAEVELQLGKKIKALRSDRGGEYLSQEFKDYLSENGIVQNLTSPYTPQQNGVSERRNRTLLDMVRSMFNLTTLPLSFWDYALESAVRILNMVPTKKVDKTPYEIWHGKAPNLSYLKVWGCEAYVKRDSADKLQQRSVKCIFVGYPKETMGYYFYFPPENKVIVARYGDFLERDLISQEFSGRDYDLEDDHMDTLPSENTSEIPVEPESLGPPSELIPVRRSERTKRAPNRLCLNMEVEDDVVGDLGEPANYKTAMLDPDKVIWQGAMDEEMNSMKVNEVWTEVDPPPNAKIVRSKWIFKKKTDMDGKVHTYKARLVAKGCTQTYGVDYEETFSPVADIRAIRILIAIAAYYDYEIWQMDVKTAFLNGRLDEDIYMEQPEGYVNPKYPNRVCKLQRSIYGLKQASRQWNKRFDEEIKRFGFTQNRDEPCVYRKASGSNVVFLILYVDDILIMGNNIPRLKEVKDYLGKCFSMKDLGEAAYILGIKIYRDRSLRLIGLNQSAYIDKILKKFSMQNSKKGFIPMEVKHDLSNEMCASSDEEKAYMKKVPYASAVGSIMYAVRCTRPDVAFAQNLVSRYQQNPGKLHWVAVKHILKYLRNTKDMFLVYGGNPDTELEVTGFCDASWQCDKDDTKSQTGYVFVVNGGAVDWKSKKQTTIAMHATQSEYMAASEAAMEAVWIRKFVGDLGVMPSINKPINMYCDNSAAITFANEPGVMKGARHFLRRYHYVREQVESGEIKLIKVHTDKNLADAFTKALPRGKVNEHANGIGLRLASSFMHICD
ncbi:putative RNA-directed DNA polymerase [Tanacetum coccineum]